MNAENSIVAVDLFCGAGGLTRGLEKAGIRVALGIDVDAACEFPYTANNKAAFLLRSVSDLTGADISEHFGEAEFTLLAGCAPCQPFSKYRLGKSDETDGRWNLLEEFKRLAVVSTPTLVTMENVPRLADQAIFAEFVATLEASDYDVCWQIVKCADYGVPQQRERLVLLASRLGPIKMISPTHAGKPRSVRDAIGGLPNLVAGEEHPFDHLHQTSTLSPINLRRIKASTPGGTWRDWDAKLVAECHKKQSGKTYPSVYGRMNWDEPSPTVTTQFFGFGNGRFGHPDQDRAISLREGAILQSFPKGYRFVKPQAPIYFKVIGRLIGNAVPVKLGQAIGRSVQLHVNDFLAREEGRKQTSR